MTARTAIIGDVGGHPDALTTALTDLGADVEAGTLPDELDVVQVGDLAHRGPDSMGVLEIVERFLANSPASQGSGRWTQLIGNHEAQYLRPDGPTFEGYPAIDQAGQDRLTHWWETDQMVVAAHVPTAGPDGLPGGTVITHAGVTAGFAFMVHQGVALGTVDAATMVEALNDLPREDRDDALWMPGAMLTGHRLPFAGPLWAEAATELYEGWFYAQGAGPMPFDQVHGHSQVFDFTSPNTRQWRCAHLVRDQCKVDMPNRHVTFRQYSGRTITGVDPCHGARPAKRWAPLVLEHAQPVAPGLWP